MKETMSKTETTKHSPGPWKARTYPNARNQITAIKIWARDEFQGELICAMSPETPASVEAPEAYANARLIAAAPELLEACENVIGKAIESPELGRGWMAVPEEVFEQIRDVISKVEGAQ